MPFYQTNHVHMPKSIICVRSAINWRKYIRNETTIYLDSKLIFTSSSFKVPTLYFIHPTVRPIAWHSPEVAAQICFGSNKASRGLFLPEWQEIQSVSWLDDVSRFIRILEMVRMIWEPNKYRGVTSDGIVSLIMVSSITRDRWTEGPTDRRTDTTSNKDA